MSVAGYLPPVIAEVLGEIGQYSAQMGKAKAEMTGLQGATTRLAAMGKVAMAGLGIAVAAVGYESVKLAADFDQTMELVHTQAGASQAEVEALKNKVLALAPAVGIGPAKLAEGLYHIESTGYRGKEAMDILAASARLAAMGLADLDTVTFAMSGVMSVAMKDVRSAADATNYLNTIVGMGDMKMNSLAAAIGTGVLPSFKSAGLGMMDFGAALATITDNSTPADEAATRLRMTISLMAAPTGAASKALKSIGMSSTQMAEDMRKPNGLLLAVMDLKHHLEASGKSAVEQNQVIEHAFGGGRTSGAILTLLEESDRLKSKYEQLGTEASRAKKADEAWAEQQKQFSQQWHELTATLQAFGVKIGNWLIPKIQATVKWMKENSETVKILAMVIGGVLLVAIAAYTVSMATAAVATIAATWPILLIIAVIAALVFGIYELVKHWDTVWNWIKKITGDVWHWIYRYIWKDGILWAFHEVEDALHYLHRGWDATWKKLGDGLKWVWDHTIGPVVHAISDAIDGVKEAASGLGHILGGGDTAMGPVHHYAGGGTVPGPVGRPQLAVVHGGEEILSNDQIRAMGRRPAAVGASAGGGSAGGGGGGGGDIVLQARFVMPDGRHMRTEILRYGRRGAVPADDLLSSAAVSGSLRRG